MSHIKVYQRVDPRFKTEKKVLRETKIIKDDMESLLESWYSYTSSTLLNEGLQDTILAKLNQLVTDFKQKISAINSSFDPSLDITKIKGFESVAAQANSAIQTINSAQVDQTVTESLDYFNAKPLQKLSKDRQKFDKLLREGNKQQLSEALIALAAYASHNPVLAIIAAVPFTLITVGRILKFFGLTKVGGAILAAGEAIERIEKTIEEAITLPIAYPLVKKIIGKANTGSKFAQILLPRDSSAYWSNPKAPELTYDEFIGGNTGDKGIVANITGFFNRLSTGVEKDVKHAMSAHHGEHVDGKAIAKTIKEKNPEIMAIIEKAAKYGGFVFKKDRNISDLNVQAIFDQIKKVKDPEAKKLIDKELAQIPKTKAYKTAVASLEAEAGAEQEQDIGIKGSEARTTHIENLRKKILTIAQIIVLGFICFKMGTKLIEIFSAGYQKIVSFFKTGVIDIASHAQQAQNAGEAIEQIVHVLEAPAEAAHAVETAEKLIVSAGRTALRVAGKT